MIATWMLYAVVVGALVLVASSALDRAARATRMPTRYIWAVALGMALLLPIALPRLSFSVAPALTEVTAGAPIATGAAEPAGPSSVSEVLLTLGDAVASIDRPLIWAWALLTATLLLQAIVATVRLRRQRARWVEREIDGERLFITPDLGPAVVAMPDTRVILPEWILAFDAASLSTVIRHERHHRLAGDLRLIIASSVAAALMPWNPAVWSLRRRLRLAVEMDCDARVLAEDPRVDRYGSLLLAIAQHPRLSPSLSATLTESTSDLERRIEAMTTRPPKRPRVIATVFAALAIIAIAIACSVPAPDAVAPPDGEVAAGSPAPQTFEFGVTRAAADPSNAPPRYPSQLRAARIEGDVVAKFVVDTTGRVDMRTFELISSTHDAFTAAVREHLPSMKFSPAQAANRKVKQLVQMPFTFAIARDSSEARSRSESPNTRDQIRQPQVFSEVPASDVASGDRSIPELIRHVAPVYPSALRQANIEGQVTARFTVKADGRVDAESVAILKSDHDAFSAAVRGAIAQMRFNPRRDAAGRALPHTMEMPFMFELRK